MQRQCLRQFLSGLGVTKSTVEKPAFLIQVIRQFLPCTTVQFASNVIKHLDRTGRAAQRFVSSCGRASDLIRQLRIIDREGNVEGTLVLPDSIVQLTLLLVRQPVTIKSTGLLGPVTLLTGKKYDAIQ